MNLNKTNFHQEDMIRISDLKLLQLESDKIKILEKQD